jgi:hypothetical protein
MRGNQIATALPARIMICGWPGSGKSGSIAALINAGLKVRVLAFDKLANVSTMTKFADPALVAANVDVAPLEDRLIYEDSRGYTATLGTPNAILHAARFMDRWKYKDGDEEVDLGSSKNWGRDTVVVVDSLTSMGEASMRKAMSLKNKTPLNNTDGVWGFAMDEQSAFLERMASNANRFHLIVLAHLKMVGPKEVRQGDDDLTKQVKADIGGLVETRLYPSALGAKLPPAIAKHVPNVLLAERVVTPKGDKRVLRTSSGPEFDTKVQARGLPSELPVETGLVTVLEAVCGTKIADMLKETSGNPAA